MDIEVWSDVACPWCFLGKKRFEKALAKVPFSGEVRVRWRSYQLDPSMPKVYPGTSADMLVKKLGVSAKQLESMHARMVGLGRADGIEYRFESVKPANTFDAHRILQLGAARGKSDAIHSALFSAYFSEGKCLGEPGVLEAIAVEAGLDLEETCHVLTTDAYADEVREDIALARRLGISGVPTFVVDRKYGLSGAQDVEVVRQMLQKAYDLTQRPVAQA